MNKIEVDSGKMEMLSRELGKLQCWLTGYHAGKGHSANMLGAGIPGEDAVRQAKLLFRDMVQASSAPAMTREVPDADQDGWIVHNGKGMPVNAEDIVDFKFRDEVVMRNIRAGLYHDEEESDSNWFHDGENHDIVAYRPYRP